MAMAEIKYLSFTISACIGSPPLSTNGNSLTIVNIIYHIQALPLSMQRYLFAESSSHFGASLQSPSTFRRFPPDRDARNKYR